MQGFSLLARIHLSNGHRPLSVNFSLNLEGCGRLVAEPVSTVSKNTILQLIYLPEAGL
jgi:hypothetical protein